MKKIIPSLMVLFCLIISSDSRSCSCLPRTSDQYYAAADFVFTGKVKSIRAAWDKQEVEFEVIESSAGDDDVTVYTALDEASCAYPFEEGQTYLVYAQEDENDRLTTDLCSGNRRIKAEK